MAVLEFTTQALAAAGNLELELVIYSGESIISSFLLEYNVIKNLRNDQSIESSNEYKALDAALMKIDKWNSQIEAMITLWENKYTDLYNTWDSQFKDKYNNLENEYAEDITKIKNDVNLNTSNITNIGNEVDEIKDAISENKPIVINDDTPIGTVIWYSASQLGSMDTTIWKAANGQSLNKSDYPELYEIMKDMYGENETTFNLPNLLSDKLFIRSCNTDITDIGQVQQDAFKNHHHEKLFMVADEGEPSKHLVHPKGANTSDGEVWRIQVERGVGTLNGGVNGFKMESIGIEETRPKNISFMPFIKVKSRAANMITVAQEIEQIKEGEDISLKEALNKHYYQLNNGFVNDFNTAILEGKYTVGSNSPVPNAPYSDPMGIYGILEVLYKGNEFIQIFTSNASKMFIRFRNYNSQFSSWVEFVNKNDYSHSRTDKTSYTVLPNGLKIQTVLVDVVMPSGSVQASTRNVPYPLGCTLFSKVIANVRATNSGAYSDFYCTSTEGSNNNDFTVEIHRTPGTSGIDINVNITAFIIGI